MKMWGEHVASKNHFIVNVFVRIRIALKIVCAVFASGCLFYTSVISEENAFEIMVRNIRVHVQSISTNWTV